jgi:threonine synthase
MMKYFSTRGSAPAIGFREAVLSGLAGDGGLYMPADWPSISENERAEIEDLPFPDAAAKIISKFAGEEISEQELARLARQAFAAFDSEEIAPVTPLEGQDFLLELYHGPTLAFKDIAMSFLAQLYGWALSDSTRGKTIVGATSGDTGGAAIHAFAGLPKTEVFMLHPKGRISDVQRRMMTTVASDNICNIAVEGTFDDCQSIVKALFADDDLRAALDLGGVNSINWVRLAIQTVYYFTAAARFDGPVAFVVPTGNFGDVFAGYAAKQMGLPIKRLGVAVNRNDIMHRAIALGVYEPAIAIPTISPSMDIQVASNFERLLFEALDRDAEAVAALMQDFERDRRLTLPGQVVERIARDFCSAAADDVEVNSKIQDIFGRLGVLVDPHTAVGLTALDKMRAAGEIEGAGVCLATAHPAKFPDAVGFAAGMRPLLPDRYADLLARKETMIEAPANVAAIRKIMLDRSLFT